VWFENRDIVETLCCIELDTNMLIGILESIRFIINFLSKPSPLTSLLPFVTNAKGGAPIRTVGILICLSVY